MEEQKEKRTSISWPATINEVKAAGYRQAPYGKAIGRCSCGEDFTWLINPNGRWQPFTIVEQSLFMPHHATCKNVQDYRQANAKHKARVEKPQPKQETIF